MERSNKLIASCRREILYCTSCEYYYSCRRIRRRRRNQIRTNFVKTKKLIMILLLLIPLTACVCGFCSLAKENSDEHIQQYPTQTAVAETEETTLQTKETREDEISKKTQEESFVTEETQLQEQEINVTENNSDESVSEDVQLIELEETEVPTPIISAYQAGELYYYLVTDEEKVYMAKLVYAEARGECLAGKVAVAAVILNRFMSDCTWFDRDSIYSVITQPYQFASISGITQSHLDQVPECMEAVEYALKGWDPTRELFENGACFFYAPDKISAAAAAEREGVPTLIIGNHAFHNEFN